MVGKLVVYPNNFNPRSPYGERLGCFQQGRTQTNFNPRSPYGERRSRSFWWTIQDLFQSTLPVRGATATGDGRGTSVVYFNPRSPYGERRATVSRGPKGRYFNPRSPYGERHETIREDLAELIISIHAPRTGSDRRLTAYGGWLKISIHAPRTGSDAYKLSQVLDQVISIHAPRTGSDSKNSQKVTLFLRQLNNFPKYHLGFPFLSRPTAFFSRKSVKKRSAKSPVFLVRLPFASKQSAHPQEHRRPSPQNARFCFHSGFQDSKTAGCPSPGP